MSSSEALSSSHFDRSARDWDARPTSQQLSPVPARLLERVPFGAEDHVLDFGAGTGLLATAIAARVRQVTALDTSAAMLQVLQAKGHANIAAVQRDIADFAREQEERFDAVVSCMAMHHVADTAALLGAFARLLRRGGRLALVDLYAEDGSFHGTPADNAAKGVQHHGFVPEALGALAADAGFEDVRFQPVLEIHQRNGRAYPLFLMTGAKASVPR